MGKTHTGDASDQRQGGGERRRAYGASFPEDWHLIESKSWDQLDRVVNESRVQSEQAILIVASRPQSMFIERSDICRNVR
jgi:hypothetical protein